MKMEIKSKDRKLLIIACSALIVVLMVRLAILPAVDVYETRKIEYEERNAQAEEMKAILDNQPAYETRISKGNARLDELSASCYEMMENRQVDELVTGAALTHQLFPSQLSISEQMEETPTAYIYSDDGALAASDQENGEAEGSSTDDTQTGSGETAEKGPDSVVRKVETSISMNGTEDNMKGFLNDIEKNYPAVHIESFEMSESMYMSTEMNPMTEAQTRIVLGIYMYSRPEK